MLDVQTTNTPSGAFRYVVPVLVDEADRIDGNPHPDWIFKTTGQATKTKMEWLFAPLEGSAVFKRLTKKQQKDVEKQSRSTTAPAPVDTSLDTARAEILDAVSGATHVKPIAAIPIADIATLATAARGNKAGAKVLRESNEINTKPWVQIKYGSKELLLRFWFLTLLIIRQQRCQCVGPHGRCSRLLEDLRDLQLGLCLFCSANGCNCECYACSGDHNSDSDSDVENDNRQYLSVCLSVGGNASDDKFAVNSYECNKKKKKQRNKQTNKQTNKIKIHDFTNMRASQ